MPISSTTKTRRHFTSAAREAAIVARRLKTEARRAAPDDFLFSVLVTRAPVEENRFGWQIRRFGDLHPVKASPVFYDSPTEALHVGRAALGALQAGVGEP